MRVEPATILVVELGSIAFFFLVLPLAVVLANLPRVWRRNAITGAILGGVVALTGLLFAIYLVGIAIIAFGGGGS